MKKLLFIVVFILLYGISFAQNTFPSNGDVLIGTTVDDNINKLQVNGGISIGSNNVNGLFSLSSVPNIPLSTRLKDFSNTSMGVIWGGDLLINNYWGVAININKGLLNDNSNAYYSVIPYTSSFTINSFTSDTTLTTLFAVRNNGNVLIGKTSQTNTNYKLDVNGNIRANQVTVNATGADYVFDPKYKLPSLDSLSDYIKTHHHLPGILSAKEMQQSGMDVGATETVLLKKIEELTLYVVKLQKEVEELKAEKR